ncbi:RHS repeat-associated core domain-containing protein [Dyella sp. 333MFSha]|uniref:RHS repeat-associated core domain-containing protein n=1 Tax=Dyella sp. 333MFSha TaxID=1798240 RepID=UPI000887F6DF|nr:RHS repeat-associated core domain-containing protein [Dyella sp. 333MFSha]SDG78177.1 RHS repeat-associated core domain-containing protein [Dyella sp. 333MFSha]
MSHYIRDRKQGNRMEKSSIWAVGSVVALSGLALAVAHRFTIEANASMPTPFALSSALDRAEVTLADGRALSLHDGALSLAGKRIALSSPRRFASLTVMPTGQVLVWGGIDDEGRLIETGEWFEPSTGALVTTGRLGLPPRAGHTLNVLSDGTLAMTGGWGVGNVPAHDVALWRPLDRHLDLLPGDGAHVRLKSEASLLADGTLQVTNGVDEIGRPVHEAWRFGRADNIAASKPHGVAASYPTRDNGGASPIGPLALRFSEPVDVAQLGGTVSLLGPNGVVKTRVVGAEDGRLAFVQLPDELYPAARYTIFVQGLRTAKGDAVPYEAIGFTTKAARSGVVLAGEGQRPGTKAPESSEPPIFVMAGAGKAVPCKPADAFHLCRDKGQVKDGAFYPGQDNVATSSGGHWRLYKDRQTLPDTKQLEANLPKGSTALIGQVRRIDESPVANVEISVDGQKVRTDGQGVFVLQHLLAGRRELFVDGRPAGSANTEYGRFIVGADVTASTVNHMPFVMYLPRVLERDKIALPSPTTRETVLTHPDMPGLELRIPAGAVFKDRDGKVLNEIAIVPTPVDHAPFPLPDNFPMYFTIQPGDAVVQGMTPEAAKGIQVVYPNYGKQKPADKADFWVYSAEKGWEMYGAGHVSADASQLVADKDTRLVWALGAGASLNDEQPDSDQQACNESAGEPIDLASGRFYHRWVDLSISDIIPIGVQRSLSALGDPASPFGWGSGRSMDNLVLSTVNGFSEPRLVLGCGEVIKFGLVSGSPVWPLVGTVWRHSSTQSSFYGATLQFLNDSTPEAAHWVMTLQDGQQFWFDRHVPNHLVRHMDRFGNAVTYQYDGGLLSRVISPSGRTLNYAYTSRNYVASVTDDTGRAVRYEYENFTFQVGGTQSSLLKKVTYPDATTEEYTYLSSDDATVATWLVKTMRDRKGRLWVDNEYDKFFRVIKQTYADGSSLGFQYRLSTGGLVAATTVTDEAGVARLVEFDPETRYPISDTYAVGTSHEQKWRYQRSSAGFILSVTDPIGRTTAYSRDGAGSVTTMTQLAGTSEASSYQMSYTADYHQLASVTDPLGDTATFGYSNGCLTSVKDPSGAETKMECDSSGFLRSVEDPQGHRATVSYQGGDLVSATNALGETDHYVYDALGRRVAYQDSVGATSLVSYNANDEIIEGVDPLGARTTYEYDATGNVKRVTLPQGGSVGFEYDARDRPVRRIDQGGRTEKWTYDARGLLTSYTDRKGQADLYEYDPLGRVLTLSYADGSAVSSVYDDAGRQIELLDTASGSISWVYDNLDRITQETAQTGSVSYNYDGADRPTAIVPSVGEAIQYSYDAVGRPIKQVVANEETSFVYDTAGNLTATQLGSGASIGYAYDANSQMLGVTVRESSGAIAGSVSYQYTPNGRISATSGSLHHEELRAASLSDSVYGLGNQQLEMDGRQATYDANGNLTTDGVLTLTWNARNQLVAVEDGGTATMYSYDGLGRRTHRKVAGIDQSYLYSGGTAIAQTSGLTTTSLIAGPGGSGALARRRGAQTRYLVSDALGSTIAVMNESGGIEGTYAYDAYGQSASDGDTFDNDAKYAGQIDDGNGLYYSNARYYRPLASRFVSPDPIGMNGGVNEFAYVDGDPINARDPSGFMTSVDWTCMRDPAFCAELFGDIVHGSADVQRKLGNPCAALGLDAVGDIAESLEKMAALAPNLRNLEKGIAKREAQAAGRAGKQARLREMMNDDKLGSADRGWLRQDANAVARGERKTLRVPPGKNMAHERGREAQKGYGYDHSNLQDADLHRLQHKYDNGGRKNRERPVE